LILVQELKEDLMTEPNQPDVKFDEKEREKQEEKSVEKYRRDPLGAIIWALILIWAGVVLLLDNLGYLDQVRSALAVESPAWLERIGAGAWPLIFLGAGVILLFEVLIRLLVPAYRRSVTGTSSCLHIIGSAGQSDQLESDLAAGLNRHRFIDRFRAFTRRRE
jgi:hypothetical protein